MGIVPHLRNDDWQFSKLAILDNVQEEPGAKALNEEQVNRLKEKINGRKKGKINGT